MTDIKRDFIVCNKRGEQTSAPRGEIEATVLAARWDKVFDFDAPHSVERVPAPGPPFHDVGRLYPQIIRYADQIVADQQGAVSRSAALARIANEIKDMAVAEAHAELGSTPDRKDPA